MGFLYTVYRQRTISLWFYNTVQEGDGTILLVVLYCKPNGRVNTVYVFTVCSNPELLQKEKDHLRKALTKCNYPKWALDKVEKRLNKSSRQVNDGGNNNAQSANHGVQSKGHIVIPTHKVFVKVSKRSVVDMASKLTSKVVEPSKTSWSPPRTRTQWSTKVVPSIGTSVGT